MYLAPKSKKYLQPAPTTTSTPMPTPIPQQQRGVGVNTGFVNAPPQAQPPPPSPLYSNYGYGTTNPTTSAPTYPDTYPTTNPTTYTSPYAPAYPSPNYPPAPSPSESAVQSGLQNLQSRIQPPLQSAVQSLQSGVQSVQSRVQPQIQAWESGLQSGLQSLESRVQPALQSLESGIESVAHSLQSGIQTLAQNATRTIHNIGNSPQVQNYNYGTPPSVTQPQPNLQRANPTPSQFPQPPLVVNPSSAATNTTRHPGILSSLQSGVQSLARNVSDTIHDLGQRAGPVTSNVGTILSSGADVSKQLSQVTLPKVNAAASSIDNAGQSIRTTSRLVQWCALALLVLLVVLIYKNLRGARRAPLDPCGLEQGGECSLETALRTRGSRGCASREY